MRIATWNVNSLSARLPAIEQWLDRAVPDVLLMQETKLADDQVPELSFRMAGYQLAHHGEGRWNGVAIASRQEINDVVTNFGDGPVRDSRSKSASDSEGFDPLTEARMIGAVTSGLRLVSVYAPNGRQVGSPFFQGKLVWLERLHQWLVDNCSPAEPLVLAGDLNVTPTDDDVWDARAAHGGTHVSGAERAALSRLRDWGLVDAYRL
ncbi:MAG TPA: exodeoxyribonuclease III, partial [Acidimicrobiia bacterium]